MILNGGHQSSGRHFFYFVAKSCGLHLMGNDDKGFTLNGMRKTFQQCLLGVRIERGGWFVQQDDIAGAEQPACDGDALCLSFAQPRSHLATGGVQALRQLMDKVCRRHMQGFPHLCIGGFGIAQ